MSSPYEVVHLKEEKYSNIDGEETHSGFEVRQNEYGNATGKKIVYGKWEMMTPEEVEEMLNYYGVSSNIPKVLPDEFSDESSSSDEEDYF
jgi:hypothetical protein